MKNYYEILEVHENASGEIITRVYKILAKKYHPDLQENNEDKKSEEKFKEIAEAYEVLSNEEKRKAYDEELLYFKNTEYQANSNAENPVLIDLENYCRELENEIHVLRNAETSQPSINTEAIQKQAHQDAMNQAYNNAYYDSLRRMGYKIRYKKTFKETLKNFIALILTISVLAILAVIVWNIPSIRERIVNLFNF